MPPTKDSPFTPPISQDEGYNHGVSINSIIVTPRVPTLSEQSPNVGIRTDEEIQMSESALKKQSAEVDAPKARVAELEKVNLITLL